MEEIKLVLLRHGETLFNVEKKVQGWSDSFLTPQGRLKAKEKALDFKLNSLDFQAIYSSDSGRTQETAEIMRSILKINPANLMLNSDLREYNYGTFEGQPDEAMALAIESEIFDKNDPSLKIRAAQKDFSVIFDVLAQIDQQQKTDGNTWYSENSDAYLTRLRKGLATIIDDAKTKGFEQVLVVTHAHSMATILGDLFPIELAKYLAAGVKLENCGDIRLTFNLATEEFHYDGLNQLASQEIAL